MGYSEERVISRWISLSSGELLFARHLIDNNLFDRTCQTILIFESRVPTCRIAFPVDSFLITHNAVLCVLLHPGGQASFSTVRLSTYNIVQLYVEAINSACAWMHYGAKQ